MLISFKGRRIRHPIDSFEFGKGVMESRGTIFSFPLVSLI